LSPGRLLLIGVLVLLCVLFAAGIGLGFTQSQDQTLNPDWTQSLGNVLIQPAHPGDLSPSSPTCMQGDLLTATGGICSYGLKAGFLGRKVRLKLRSAGVLGILVTLEQPDVGKQTKRLLVVGQEATLNYQKEASELRVQCLDPAPPCRLHLESD